MDDRTSASRVRYPTHRSFVVQFEDGVLHRDVLRGRAEHLTSGQIVHFDSLNKLGEFVKQVLREAGRA